MDEADLTRQALGESPEDPGERERARARLQHEMERAGQRPRSRAGVAAVIALILVSAAILAALGLSSRNREADPRSGTPSVTAPSPTALQP